MRVCFLAPFNPLPSEGTKTGGHMGGVERYSDCLTRALARKGVTVTLVCSGDEDMVTEQDGVRIVQRKRLGIVLRTPISFLHSEFLGDHDVYHVPATYPTYSEVLPFLARIRDTPCVLDYHFDVPPFGDAARLLAPVYYAVARHGFALSDAIILKNEGYERKSPGLRGLPRSLFHVIPNGVDTDFYRPAEGDATTTPVPTRDYFLFTGRLVPFKGVDVLIDALARVPEKKRLPLRVIGSGPAFGALAHKAKTLGVHVEFHGYVTNETLRHMYRNARATILPSLTNQESFGMTLVESMACGTPVITSDLAGTRYVRDLGGVAAPPGDANALAEVLHRYGDAMPTPNGPALAARVHARFSWERVAEDVIRLYEDTIARRARGRHGENDPIREGTPPGVADRLKPSGGVPLRVTGKPDASGAAARDEDGGGAS